MHRGIIYGLNYYSRVNSLISFTYTSTDAALRAIHTFTPHQTADCIDVCTTSSSPTHRPAAAIQHVLRPMEAAAARRKRLVPAA